MCTQPSYYLPSSRPRFALAALVLFFSAVDFAPAQPPDGQGDKAAEETQDQPTQTETPKLQFTFRNQQWMDVLQFLANEAKLSLQVIEPPPGSFSYSDPKEYSPTEAINLVNGVLATKGYTLIRRERLLMLVKMDEASLKTFAPRVSLEEAQQRGSFEVVTVTFDLEGRDPQQALSEIQPLLGPNSSAAPLSATKRLVVTDRAGVMQAIAVAIESLPKPKPPPQPKPKQQEEKKPEKKELRIYPLQGADAGATIRTLEELVEAKFVSDPQGERVNAYATPSQHNAIEKLVEQLRGTGETKQFRLETYPIAEIGPADRTNLIENLQLVAPDVPMRISDDGERLAVWARQPQHEAISVAVSRLKQPIFDTAGRQLKLYTVHEGGAAEAVKLLDELLPAARISQGGGGDRLIVLATAEQQKMIAELVDQLRQQHEQQEALLRTYPLADALDGSILNTLRRMVPGAQIDYDAARRRLTVVTTAKKQQQVFDTLRQLAQQATPLPERTLQVYPVTKAQAERFHAVQNTVLPRESGMSITFNDANTEMLVWAHLQQHEQLQTVLDRIKQFADNDTTAQLVAYPVGTTDLTSSSELLAKVAPKAEIVADESGRRLLIWATPQEHGLLRPAAAQLKQGDTDPGDTKFQSYSIDGLSSDLAEKVLRDAVPGIQVELDPRFELLVVQATEAQHVAVSELVKNLREGVRGRRRDRVEFYPIEGDANSMVDLLEDLFPRMDIVASSVAGGILAAGDDEQHLELRNVVDRFSSIAANERTVEVFSTHPASAYSIYRALRNIVPSAEISVDSSSDSLAVTGTTQEIESVRQVVEAWKKEAEKEDGGVVVAYRVSPQFSGDAKDMLDDVVPDARVSRAGDAGQVVVRGSERDHAIVREVLNSIKKKPAPDTTLVAYPLAGEHVELLRQVIPPQLLEFVEIVAPPTAAQTLVRATSPQHELIKPLVEKLQQQVNEASGRVLEVYELKHAAPDQVAATLRAIDPSSQVVPDLQSASVAVTTTKPQQQRMAAAIARLDRESVAGNLNETVVYPIASAQPEVLVQTLQSVFAPRPGETTHFTYDQKLQAVVAVAPQMRQDDIRSLVQAVEKTGDVQAAEQSLRVYALNDAGGPGVQAMLQQLFNAQGAQVQLTLENATNRLMAVARPAEHDLIQQALDGLKQAPAEFAVYQLDVVDPFTAATAIDQLFAGPNGEARPNAPSTEADIVNYRLYVRGSNQQLESIREMLVKMGEVQLTRRSEQNQTTTRFVPLRSDIASAIQRIEQVWPKLRGNELRVLESQSAVPVVPGNRTPLEQSDAPLIDQLDAKGAEESTDDSTEGPSASDMSLLDDGGDAWNDDHAYCEPGDEEFASINENSSDAGEEVASDNPPTDPPVFIVPSDQGVTLYSEDTAALTQLENLLRLFTQGNVRGGHRFGVFLLRNASAGRMADTLNELFEKAPLDPTVDPVLLVADNRLNALIVLAGRAERQEVEKLIEVLDSEQSAEALAANQPVLIPLEHASATRVADQIRELYRAQLTAGGGRSRVEVPSGIDPDVAAVLQQINAMSQAPLISLDVDRDTNSLLMVGPKPLVTEIRQFAQMLDEASAKQSRRGVKVVPLSTVSSEQFEGILDNLLQSGSD